MCSTDLISLLKSQIELVNIFLGHFEQNNNFCSSNLKYTSWSTILDYPLGQMNIIFVHLI